MTRRALWPGSIGAAVALASFHAEALEPDQIYALASPSIVSVRALDPQERPIATASGIVVAPERVVTNCSTLARAKLVQVRYTNIILEARLESPDVERDLCVLEVKNLSSRPVATGSARNLRIGQRIYAIAAGGPDVSITDGVISSFRDSPENPRSMEITARLSKTSGGGGVFDSEGKLIGVITSQLRSAQNYASPVDWLGEIAERGKATLSRSREAAGAATGAAAVGATRPAPAFQVGGSVEQPDIQVGDRWRYQVTDLFTNIKTSVTIEVHQVTPDRIHTRTVEQPAETTAGAVTPQGIVEVWDRNWNQVQRNEVRFKPYFPTYRFPLEVGKAWSGKVAFDVADGVTLAFEVESRVTRWEQITVPAGTYDTVRVVMKGYYDASGSMGGNGTVSNVFWYAPAIRQIVRQQIEHRSSGSTYAMTQGASRNQRYERWELTEFRN
jgi:hypothetical protein